MNEGLYSVASAMSTAEQQLTQVTSNLANINTVGFKRTATAAQSFAQTLHGQQVTQVRMVESRDHTQGVLRATGEETHLALDGEGFFVVETPNGEAYTRDGRFVKGQDGTLQTLDGFPVAWSVTSGAIDPTGVRMKFDGEGQVYQGEAAIGGIQLANFADPSRLVIDEFGYLTAPRGEPQAPVTATVHQGHLENANTTAVDEMIEMIQVQRRFEAASRMMTMIEQSYRRLVQGQ